MSQQISFDELLSDVEALNLESDRRTQIAEGIRIIRDLMGPGFVDDVLSTGHPLMMTVINRAAHSRAWLGWFGHALSTAVSLQGFPELRKRLIDPRRASEGISTLELVWRFTQAGFVAAPETPVRGRHIKVPDITLVHPETRLEIYVEHTHLGPSEEDTRAHRTQQQVWLPLLTRFDIQYCGSILKVLSEPRCAEVVDRLSAEIAQLGQDKSFIDLSQPGILRLAACTEEGKEHLQAWASASGEKLKTLSGPPIEDDQVGRVRRTIRRKQLQIPESRPGVVIIRTPPMMLMQSPRTICESIEETLFDHSCLAAVVLWSNNLGAGEEVRESIGDHFHVIQRAFDDVHVSRFLFLTNRYMRCPIPTQLRQDIKRAFAECRLDCSTAQPVP